MGGKLQGGRKSYFHESNCSSHPFFCKSPAENNCSSHPLFSLRVFSNCLRICVRILKCYCESFGGVKEKIKGKFTRKNGNLCGYQNRLEVWILEILEILMNLCCQNMCVTLFMILFHFSIESLRQSIFQIALFLGKIFLGFFCLEEYFMI